MKHRGPLVLTLLLLSLLVLYVASYFALVVRRPMVHLSLTVPTEYSADYYRLGGDYAELVFWPLEQIDRLVQPATWNELDRH